MSEQGGSINWPYNEPFITPSEPYVYPPVEPSISPFTWSNLTISPPEPDEVIITRADNGWSVEFNGNQLTVFTNYQEMIRFLSERYGQLDEDEDEASDL